VRLTGIVGTDFPEAHTQLFGAHAVDLAGLERVPGKTFRWSGVYANDFSTRTTLDTQLNVFSDFRPKLPPAWTDSPYVFLANIDPVLQLGVLEQAKKPRFVACDTMNLWIDIKRAELERVMREVDLVIINEAEVRQFMNDSNLVKGARAILALGPKTIVVKRGEYGVMMITPDAVFAAPAYPLETVFDPTGAGDTFAGGFLGYLSSRRELHDREFRRAIIFGSVLASFTVEKFSLDRLREITLADVQERYQAFRELTHFEDFEV